MSEKMKNLVVRTLSGVVLAAVVIGAVLLSKWSFGLLLLAILVGGMFEFYSLASKQGNAPQWILGIATGVLLYVMNFVLVWNGQVIGLGGSGSGWMLILLSVPLMFICELYRKNPNPFAAVGTTLMGIFYVAIPIAMMSHFPFLLTGSWQPLVMLFYIFIIWANDVFAYLVGMTLGRHKLFERLSPKKSWEGFFGGLAGAVAMGVVAAYVLDASVWMWVGLALVAAVAAVLGDLAESMFKRAAGVKDSGTLIPGHGGVLDRFDAMLLSAPFVFMYLLFVL